MWDRKKFDRSFDRMERNVWIFFWVVAGIIAFLIVAAVAGSIFLVIRLLPLVERILGDVATH